MQVAYDEILAERVRDILLAYPGLREQKMFGGLAFMVGGYMCCGVVGDELMVRLGQDGAKRALERGWCALSWLTTIPPGGPSSLPWQRVQSA